MTFVKISRNFIESPLKFWFYLSDYSPQFMACKMRLADCYVDLDLIFKVIH